MKVPVLHTYQVKVSYDGCDNGDKPLFEGVRAQCLAYMRAIPTREWNRLNSGKFSIDLLNKDTKRFESYVL